MKKIITAIGVLSGIITIFQFLQALITERKIVITPLIIVCGCIVIGSVLTLTIFSHKRLQYFIYKCVSYVTRRPNLPYYLKEKEIRYTYKTRSDLSYQKKTVLIAQVNGLTSFKSKFRWSKPQRLEDFHVTCTSPHTKLTLGRDTTWNTYTVEFPSPPKGGERTVDILIDNLSDLNCEAVPFCSASIVERTKKLKIVVALEGGVKFKLDSIRFLVYDNGASTFPVLEEAYSSEKKNKFIKYDPEHMQITVEEKYPVYGYKYQLAWDFQ